MTACVCSPRVQRWVGFAISCLVLLLGGSYFLLGILEEDMKAEFDLSQQAVELIVAFGACSANLGYPWGLLLEHISDRTAFLISMVLGSISGVLLYSADYMRQFYSDYWWLLAIYWGGVCSSFVIGYLVAVAVTLGNFPSRRKGAIMSALNCTWWFGQSLFNYLYTVTQSDGRPAVGTIFLILGVCIFVVKGLGVFLIRSVPLDEDDVEYSTLIKDEGSSIVRAEEADSSMDENDSGKHQRAATGGELKESWIEKLGLRLFLDPDFHCVAWGFVIGVGTEVMYMGNVSSIAAALSMGSLYETTLVVAPITGMVSTFVCGWLSDFTRDSFPRSLYLAVGGVCNAIMFAVSAVYGTNSAVFILTTMTMYGTNGISYSITGTVVGERFGMPHFKRNWGLILMGSAGMTLITTTIFGALYDNAITNRDVRFCKGITCVQNIFIVGCIFSLVSAVCFTLFERRHILRCFRRIKERFA